MVLVGTKVRMVVAPSLSLCSLPDLCFILCIHTLLLSSLIESKSTIAFHSVGMGARIIYSYSIYCLLYLNVSIPTR